MARSLNQFIAELPAEEQAEIETRYRTFKQEVEGLRALAGKDQADVASALNIKQPSISEIKK